MVMKVTGENLAAIEVLGGLLGMLAGIALKRPEFLVLLPAVLALLLAIEFLATRVTNFFKSKTAG